MGSISAYELAVRSANSCLDRLYRLRCKFNIFRTSGLAEARRYNPLRLHWIPPDALTREIPGPKFRRKYTPGVVVGGDWDRFTVDFHRIHFRGFQQRYIEGYSWEDTDLFRDVINRAHGNYWHGCVTESEILDRLRWYDSIYKSIARDGYLTQRELAYRDNLRSNRRIKLLPPELGEIIVHIDRDGNYIFDDGRHRLSIAKILGLEVIPVLVVVRHRQWYRDSIRQLRD
jgi:hypothetical protein